MDNPIVSVIIPVYNGEQYLRSAIDSVLHQTFQDFELIVVDDGSTDSTPAIVQSYGEQRIRYVQQDNAGAGAAFNKGIRLSLGHYISWLSHDDVFEPAKLEMQLDAISQSATPAVCYTDVQVIDKEGTVISEQELPEYEHGELLRQLITAGAIGTAAYSLLYDRRCIDVVGLYDESQRYTQDADMLLRLARRFSFVHVPQKLMKIREHADRGLRVNSKNLEIAAVKFYGEWLDRLDLEELFPELKGKATKLDRAKARQWLADRLAYHPFPPYRKIAMTQYRKALFESPTIIPYLIKHYIERHPQFYSLGLRTAVARRFSWAKRID